MEKGKSYVQGIYECLNEFCKSYCKYKNEYEKMYGDDDGKLEELIELHCQRCPLARIM